MVSFQNAVILNSDLVATELQREQWGYASAEKAVSSTNECNRIR